MSAFGTFLLFQNSNFEKLWGSLFNYLTQSITSIRMRYNLLCEITICIIQWKFGEFPLRRNSKQTKTNKCFNWMEFWTRIPWNLRSNNFRNVLESNQFPCIKREENTSHTWELAAKNASLFQNWFSKKWDQIDMETAWNFSGNHTFSWKSLRFFLLFFPRFLQETCKNFLYLQEFSALAKILARNLWYERFLLDFWKKSLGENLGLRKNNQKGML